MARRGSVGQRVRPAQLVRRGPPAPRGPRDQLVRPAQPPMSTRAGACSRDSHRSASSRTSGSAAPSKSSPSGELSGQRPLDESGGWANRSMRSDTGTLPPRGTAPGAGTRRGGRTGRARQHPLLLHQSASVDRAPGADDPTPFRTRDSRSGSIRRCRRARLPRHRRAAPASRPWPRRHEAPGRCCRSAQSLQDHPPISR